MHFISLSRSLRLLAVALFSVSLLGCFVVEEGDGPDEVVDPLFVNVPPPAAVVPAALAVFAETSTAPVLAITSITNSAIFGGNDTVADPASTAIMPVEGCNVLAIDYQDNGQPFGGAVLNFGGADLATGSFDTLHFTIDTSAIAGYDDMTIQMEPPGAAAPGTNVALSSYTPVSTSGNWRTYAIPLADFSTTNFAALDNLGFWNVVDAGDSLVFGTLYLDNIYYTASTGNGAGTGGCVGGQLLTNGDFEAGNLSSWSPADNGGTITAVDTQDSGSTWSANVVAGPTNNPALSQVNLAVGTVLTGDLIDVSFDMCGSLSGVGGVVFPAVLSEFGVGIGADRQTLDTFNDLNMPSVWTRYNYQAIAGANVAGGVSLQFDVICGGDPTCAANVYFDNVSATIGGGIVPGAASGNTCAGGGGGPVSGAVFDDVVDSQWVNSLSAFDQAIGFASCIDDGGAGCPSIGWSLVADMARGDVIDVVYENTANFAGMVIGQTPAGLDFSSFAGGNVVFDLNVTNNPGGSEFKMKVDCVGCPTDAGQREQSLGVPGGGWQTFAVAVDDMVNANGGPTVGGLRLDQVTTGLVVFPAFGTTSGITYQIDNIRWEAPPPPPPPVSGAVFDDVVDSQWVNSLSAFDQAIGFASCIDDGGAGCPSIGWSLVADMARGDVIDVVYENTANFAGMVIGQTPAGLDFSSFAGGNVVFDLNVTNNPGGSEFKMKVDCVGCPTDAGQREQSLGVPGAGWQTFTVAVDDMVNANGGPTVGGLKLDQVTTGLVVFPAFGTTSGITYQIDNIRWEAAGGGPGGELAVNGGFETGDFTGWQQSVGDGVQTISADTPSGSSFSASITANLVPGAGGVGEIKQANLAAGTIALGDTVRIQFDVKGTFGPGGILNVLSFTEFGGGGATLSNNTGIDGAFAGGVDIGNGWFHYDYNVTLGGPDADGGFSLAFNPVCGAVPGCVADVLIDNVSIVGP